LFCEQIVKYEEGTALFLELILCSIRESNQRLIAFWFTRQQHG
jgi:hypothetical protein